MLDPVAGYVVKTSTLVGEKKKVFINICVDAQVPTPETMDIAAITTRVMAGGDWVVPIVVSAEKSVSDKAGNPAKVFDCCMNPKILYLGVEDPGIKVLVNETCIELVEDASGYELDRNYTIPRMKAKGDLSRMEFSPADLHRPRALEEVLAAPTASTASTASTGAPTLAAAAPPTATPPTAPPKIEIVGESGPAYAVHPYTRTWGGTDAPPQLEIEMPGKHMVKIDGDIVIGESRVSAGAVEKAEAVYTSDDDSTHVFVWCSAAAV